MALLAVGVAWGLGAPEVTSGLVAVGLVLARHSGDPLAETVDGTWVLVGTPSGR